MSKDFPVTIFHNPSCGTSRNTLAMIEAAGYAPTVVPYLQAGWTAAQLKDLFSKAGISARDAMRVKNTPAEELGLTGPDVSEDTIIEAMTRHPILVERPIVATPRGVTLCRPSEKVLNLLDDKPAAFTKEDGEVVIPAK